jgi:hypothetical protein
MNNPGDARRDVSLAPAGRRKKKEKVSIKSASVFE